MSKPKLDDYSEQELLAELLKRQQEKPGDKCSRQQKKSGHAMYAAEVSGEAIGRAVGREGFGAWLAAQEAEETDGPKACPKCGRKVPVKVRKRERTLDGLHGRYTYRRHYHYCEPCKHGFYPLDEGIGAPHVGRSSGALDERALDFAINAPYGEAAERFEMHYGRCVSTHFLRCLIKRVPLPTYAEQPKAWKTNGDRVTVQVDGCHLPMQDSWKEAKLGVVFAEAHHTRGSAHSNTNVRGAITEASYVATMGDVAQFETHLKQIIPKRRTRQERQSNEKRPEVVFVADGAPWIWNLQKRLYPEAIGILDWIHAVEKATTCGAELLGENPSLRALWKSRVEQLLAEGQVSALLEELAECRRVCEDDEGKRAISTLLRYYNTHRRRMNYSAHRAAGRVIGSGVVESSHRHVLQARMKRAGMHWSQHGAEKMARLRAVYRTVGPKSFYSQVTKMAA